MKCFPHLQEKLRQFSSCSLCLVMIGGALLTANVSNAQTTLYVCNFRGSAVTTVSSTGVTGVYTNACANPNGLAFDPSRNLYITDYYAGAIRKIAPDRSASTLVTGLQTPTELVRDTSGNLFTISDNTSIVKISPTGTTSVFATNSLGFSSIALDHRGNLFASTYGDHSNITEFSASGAVFPDIYANVGNFVQDMAFDSHDTLFYSHIYGRISKIAPDGTPTPFVHVEGSAGIEGTGLTFDASDNLFASSASLNNISKITPAGNITLFSSGSGFNNPTKLVFGPVPVPSPSAFLTTLIGTLPGITLLLRRQKKSFC